MVYRLWVHCKRSPAMIEEKAKSSVIFHFWSSHTQTNWAAFMTCAIEAITSKHTERKLGTGTMKNRIMIICYLPQGYPRESCAKFPALENIPSIFQCHSSIHTHCKGLYNRIPAQNSFHRTILNLKQNNGEEKKTTKISINNNGNE